MADVPRFDDLPDQIPHGRSDQISNHRKPLSGHRGMNRLPNQAA